jgi:hypothetical protein
MVDVEATDGVAVMAKSEGRESSGQSKYLGQRAMHSCHVTVNGSFTSLNKVGDRLEY